MIGQYNEYQNTLSHNNIKSNASKCDSMENMETYSKEVELGKKKVKLTIKFPCAADPKDTDRFEHMLKEVYLDKIQKGYLQSKFNGEISFAARKKAVFASAVFKWYRSKD